MAGRTEQPGPDLRGLLRELAAEDLVTVIELAREDARARVRAALADVLTEAMLAGATAPAPPTEPEERGDALYVLCVVAADTELPPAARGIGERPVYAMRNGELAAVVCPVPLAEFGEDTLRERLQDMDWLERTARAHEAALEEIGERATLVPLRLCTVFHAESGVRELLLRESARLGAALTHLDGRREWGVKVFAADEPPESAADSTGGPGASGSDYLRRRQQARNHLAEHAEAVDAACQEIHQQLGRLADDVRRNPPQRTDIGGGHGPMVLNGAYLVADEIFDEFLERVQALGDRYVPLGLVAELTGPWPAYNFVPDAIGVA